VETPVLSFPTLLRRWNQRSDQPYSIIKLFSTEVGQAIYFVLDGTVSLRRTLADSQQVLARMEKGDSFGALALLLDEPRVMQAVAQTNCRLAVFFRSDLHQLMDTRAPAAFKISLEMARHLAHNLRRVAINHGSVEI
jgi:CRP/FNR family transcriptional regulator, cyclic AMP receptor protein